MSNQKVNAYKINCNIKTFSQYITRGTNKHILHHKRNKINITCTGISYTLIKYFWYKTFICSPDYTPTSETAVALCSEKIYLITYKSLTHYSQHIISWINKHVLLSAMLSYRQYTKRYITKIECFILLISER